MQWPELCKLHEGRSVREGLKLWICWLALWIVLCLTIGLGRMNATVVWVVFFVVAILSLLIILRFFRDFAPVFIDDKDAVVSPAHGIIDAIELCEGPSDGREKRWRISIYLSLRDVHVQNAPISGTVASLQFIPGERRRAIHADATQRNEALLLHFASGADREVFVKLIAGVFVRRIVPWIAPGQRVFRGQRISLIRFGSRADIYLPSDATIFVKPGDRVVGSETVLGTFAGI